MLPNFFINRENCISRDVEPLKDFTWAFVLSQLCDPCWIVVPECNKYKRTAVSQYLTEIPSILFPSNRLHFSLSYIVSVLTSVQSRTRHTPYDTEFYIKKIRFGWLESRGQPGDYSSMWLQNAPSASPFRRNDQPACLVE